MLFCLFSEKRETMKPVPPRDLQSLVLAKTKKKDKSPDDLLTRTAGLLVFLISNVHVNNANIFFFAFLVQY